MRSWSAALVIDEDIPANMTCTCPPSRSTSAGPAPRYGTCYVRAGKLRALAVTIATRSPVLPDLPTVAEFVPGYEFSFWTGVGVHEVVKINSDAARLQRIQRQKRDIQPL
jgi:hypothetical protein